MPQQPRDIHARFHQASQSYDRVAFVQKEAAAFLVDQLVHRLPGVPQRILDVGTGTGYIPQLLLQHFPNTAFDLNDISQGMLDVCKAKFASTANMTYLAQDMMTLSAQTYDCVVTSLALQWVKNLPNALAFLYAKSTQVFAFSTLLQGTFCEWQERISSHCAMPTGDYPTQGTLIEMCTAMKRPDQRFEFWTLDVPIAFKSSLAFMRYLKFLGASSTKTSMGIGALRSLLIKDPMPITVTYKIFFGLFAKEA
jgi:malonyl-CoA O-methyltransferase